MLFSEDAVAGLWAGTTTATFRTWTRAQVKVGGIYRPRRGLALEVDAVGRVQVAELTDADAIAAGERDRDALLRRLRWPAADEDVWRIDFHRVDVADPRQVLAATSDLDAAAVDELDRRLDRLDRASKLGPWTRATLALIGERPGVVSTTLAERLDRDRPSFKRDVRKLKALGLTESLDVGYRLSPRGQAYLSWLGRGPR